MEVLHCVYITLCSYIYIYIYIYIYDPPQSLAMQFSVKRKLFTICIEKKVKWRLNLQDGFTFVFECAQNT